MKILLAQPGKLNTVPMGGFVLNALKKLGHEVVDFDLSSGRLDKLSDKFVIRPDEFHGRLNRRFRSVVEETNPDLMLTIFGFDLSEISLSFLKKKGIPRVCWWLNDPFQFKRSLSKADRYDFVFTNAKESVENYRNAGINHAHWLPTACDPDVHRRVPFVSTYQSDICFAGDWSPLREEWCTELAKHFDVKVFGPWKKKLRRTSPLWGRVVDGFFTPAEMAGMFSSAKIVFNLHSWYGKWDCGTNPRLFEVAGCGACQVVDWKEDIPGLFEIGRDLAVYHTRPELVGLIHDLLNDPVARRTMGENSQRHAYEYHTYEARMRTLIERVCSRRMPSG